MNKDCLFCNKTFEANKPKQKFCSDKCRVYFNREESYEGGFVYCLKNPLKDDEIFYIGKTIVSLNKRLQQHISESRKSESKKASVIKEILSSGQDVILEQIEFVSADNIKDIEKILSEREFFWIKEYSGKDGLTNKALTGGRKTKQIGVRFDEELWETFEQMGYTTAQRKLNFLESWYLDNLEKVIAFNNLPENKATIEDIRNGKIKSAKVTKDENNKPQVGIKIELPNNEYGFDLEDTWFLIDKYTKHPKKEMPSNIWEQSNWLKEKDISDRKIKLAWQEWKKSLK